MLYGLKYDLAQIRAGNALRPTGGITCGFDASSLFEEGYVPEGWSVYDTMKARLEELSLTSFSVRHAVQVSLARTPKIVLTMSLLSLRGKSLLKQNYSLRLGWDSGLQKAAQRPHIAPPPWERSDINIRRAYSLRCVVQLCHLTPPS